MTKIYDVLIIGGGAAGVFLAARLNGACVVEMEKRCLKKLALTGGGKCNFSNAKVSAEDYVSANAHFVKSALSAFGPKDFIAFLEENKLAWEEREHGRLFLKTEASALCSALLERARERGAQFLTGTQVLSVTKEGEIFTLKTKNIDLEEGILQAKNVVVATGGLALYGSDSGLDIAKSFGLKTIAPRPALVPVIVPGMEEYAGISLPVKTTFGSQSFQDGLVFTHEGLGGPVVYQISLYTGAGDTFEVDFLPKINLAENLSKLRSQNINLASYLADFMPKRLAKFFVPEGTPELSNISNKNLEIIINKVKRAHFLISALDGYKKAEVMRGGVNVSEISSKTMESKVKGLYFIGETLDVTGRLGGYNLHFAWASAAAAAKALK